MYNFSIASFNFDCISSTAGGGGTNIELRLITAGSSVGTGAMFFGGAGASFFVSVGTISYLGKGGSTGALLGGGGIFDMYNFLIASANFSFS